eukprot:1160012-Pelagomonas_calceolata.AAC.8
MRFVLPWKCMTCAAHRDTLEKSKGTAKDELMIGVNFGIKNFTQAQLQTFTATHSFVDRHNLKLAECD